MGLPNQNPIAEEEAARIAADAQEETAREAADDDLQTKISTEQTAREAADTGLQKHIDTIELTPGDKGDAGATWLSGTVAHTDEGVDGDFYLNTTDSQVYKKEDGAWVEAVNIKGLPGVNGQNGAAGADSAVGAAGPEGPAGADAPDRTAEICELYTTLNETFSAGLTLPDYCAPATYSIGDTGPAGGIVFYITEDGLNGLEAAPVDQADRETWCSTNTDIAGVDNITCAATPDSNSGEINTPLIAAICGPDSAAGVAANYVWPNGQSDGFFLPNKEELNLLYAQKDVVGGFAYLNYWSSSERDDSLAWYEYFSIGLHTYGDKDITIRVRAVRAF